MIRTYIFDINPNSRNGWFGIRRNAEPTSFIKDLDPPSKTILDLQSLFLKEFGNDIAFPNIPAGTKIIYDNTTKDSNKITEVVFEQTRILNVIEDDPKRLTIFVDKGKSNLVCSIFYGIRQIKVIFKEE